ncbi:MAG TPA: AAA family ATPase [Streptosporangiaceae bacterium]|nr:AAA family ATPase [Streptosporangiaceae bacterium]
MSAAPLPVLVVVSGPMGSGKTTLAHQIARSAGCPAICRDEIKEGMVHAAPGFVAGPGDELTMRTLPVFFGVLELLLRAGVTTVAEAAFQDKVWRAGLEPLSGIARIRIVHCVVDAEVAFGRSLRRRETYPLRRAHADPRPADAAARASAHRAFDRLSLAAPWIEVDTTDGYVPSLDEIVAFAVGRELRPVRVAVPPACRDRAALLRRPDRGRGRGDRHAPGPGGCACRSGTPASTRTGWAAWSPGQRVSLP